MKLPKITTKNLKTTLNNTQNLIIFGLFFFIITLLIITIAQTNHQAKPDFNQGDQSVLQAAQDYAKKYPAINHLPIIYAHYSENFEYTEYRIDGGKFPNCQQDFCLKITDVTGNNKEKALNHLKSLNINPSDYQIIYENQPIQPLE